MKNKTLTFDEIINILLEEDKDINWNNITEVYTRNLPNKKMTSVNLRLIFNDKLDVVPKLKEEQRFNRANKIAEEKGGSFIGEDPKSPQFLMFKCSEESHIPFRATLNSAKDVWCKQCSDKKARVKSPLSFTEEESKYIKMLSKKDVSGLTPFQIFDKFPGDFLKTPQRLTYLLTKARIPFKITEKKAQEVKKLASFLEANKSLISNMTLIQIMNFAEENEFKVTRDKVHYTLEFNNFEYLN